MKIINKIFSVTIVITLAMYLNTNAQEKIEAPFNLAINKITFPIKTFSIIDFGAKNGAKFKCTEAFRKAIDKAHKSGGGYIEIPKGKWLTGPIVLKDNICLRFEEGAELFFSTDTYDYLPVVWSRHQGIECYKHSAFIYAKNATNIGIIGKGILHGQGKVWWNHRNSIPKNKDPWIKCEEMSEKNTPVKDRIFDDINKNFLCPCFIMPMNCTNVLIKDIKVMYGAYWTINPVYCNNIIVRDVEVKTHGDYGWVHNGDGINLSSCKNALIENCLLDTGDDCITIKSGRNKDGYRVGISTENVVIRNCKSLKGHGGVVIGSETAGGIRNIYIHDCEFNGTDRGLRIKSARGRCKYIENIWLKNIQMGMMKGEAIKINMLYKGERYPAQKIYHLTPRMRNFHFENITCKDARSYAIRIEGLPEMNVESMTFNNLNIRSKKGIMLNDVSGITIENSKLYSTQNEIFTINNCSNINISELDAKNKMIKISGENSENIRFIDCSIDYDKISGKKNSFNLYYSTKN